MILQGALFFLIHMGGAVHAAPSLPVVNVPAGSLTPFWMTVNNKTGQVEALKVPSFSAMVYPVTNAQYLAFVQARPEWRKSKVKKVFAEEGYLGQFTTDSTLKAGVKENAPVNYVSWFAAQAFCESHGMRLPTILEWEYMSAASETKADASRDPEFLNRILEWYSEPRAAEGLPVVGQRRANVYGVHDLHGLIWEIVEDFNSSLLAGEGRTEGTLSREMFCGAGATAGNNKENYAAYMRFAYRSSLKGARSAWNLGFRCVRGDT